MHGRERDREINRQTGRQIRISYIWMTEADRKKKKNRLAESN